MAKTRSHLTSSQRARVRRAAGLPPSARKTPTRSSLKEPINTKDMSWREYFKLPGQLKRPTVMKRKDFGDPPKPTRVSGGHPKSGRGKVVKVGWGKPQVKNAGKSYTVSTLSREQKSNLKKATPPRIGVSPTQREYDTWTASRKSAKVAYEKLRKSYGLGSSQKTGKSR